MPKALITGATGQDGSYLCERLSALDWDVHAMVRNPQPDEQSIPEEVTTHCGDLARPESVAAIIESVEPDVIYNLGGVSSVAQSWDEPDLTSRVTGHSVAVMMDAAWRLQVRLDREVRFLQASSSEIFGSAQEFPQTESTPIRPVSPYGAAKAYAHHLVEVYRGKGLFAASAILYNHESPRRPKVFVTRKITAGVAAVATGRLQSIELGNLDALRDWGWAPDYVEAMLTIASAPAPDDFIVATGVAHRVREFVAEAFAAVQIADWERYVTVDARLNRPVDAGEMIGDNSKIREYLGWSPQTGFEELIQRMVAYDLELLRL